MVCNEDERERRLYRHKVCIKNADLANPRYKGGLYQCYAASSLNLLIAR
jgi:hypothetical protein